VSKKKVPPHIVQLQAEGTKAERDLIREETYKEARKLALQMPTFGPHRLIYIRNLVTKVLRDEMDLEVFKTFVKITNSYLEVETCAPRAKSLMGRK